MRRLLIGLILAVCLIAGTTAIASADNILTNAGFESGKLTPWQQAQGKNAGFEYFTISKQTPHSGTYCVYGRGNTETRYNGFTTLVQDVELKPERGASYRISGFAKAAFTAGSGKKVSIAVREVDAEGKTIRYQDVQIDPAKTDWTSYVKVFTVSDKTVSFSVYIILNNLNNNDGVYFDDIAFEAISGGGQAFVPGKALPKSGQVIELKSAQFAVEIDASTGLLRQLVSLQPQPQVLHPAASQSSVVFFRTPGGEVKFHRSGPIRQEGRDKVSFTLVPDDAALPLKAQISYWMSKECFHESVVFESTGNIDGVSTLGLRHGFVPSSWEKIIGALRHVKVVNSNEQAIFSYGERKNDLNLAKLDSWQNVVFPMTVLEGRDRFVLVGDACMDNFVTISPNHPEGYFPSVQQNPKSVSKGEKFTFNLIYRSFNRNESLLRDAWRWYASNVYSNDPLIKDFIAYKERPNRPFPDGCFASYPAFNKARENRMYPGSNMWWYGWHDTINESYPVSGSWLTPVNNWNPITAEQMRDEIARLSKKNFKAYMYFRQLANLRLKGSTVPDDWFRVKSGGALERYGGGYSVPLPEKVQKVVGYKDIPWGTYDFQNEKFRAHYLSELKAAVNFYNPAGVAWDMGWEPDHAGMFRMQADVYLWLKEKHPGMRVVSNEGLSPTQYYSDLVLVENGLLGGKTWYDFEASKAFSTNVVCLERFNLFDAAVANALTGKKTWLPARGLDDNKRFMDFVLAAKPEFAGNDKKLAWICQARASLRDIGMGASPGYIEECKPMSDAMVRFAGEIVGTPLVNKSYALRLNGLADRDGDLYTSGWVDKNRIRLAVYNDTTQAKPVRLLVDGKFLASNGWKLKKALAAEQSIVTYDMSEQKGNFNVSSGASGLVLSGELPPFSALLYFADSK